MEKNIKHLKSTSRNKELKRNVENEWNWSGSPSLILPQTSQNPDCFILIPQIFLKIVRCFLNIFKIVIFILYVFLENKSCKGASVYSIGLRIILIPQLARIIIKKVSIYWIICLRNRETNILNKILTKSNNISWNTLYRDQVKFLLCVCA